MHNYRFSCSRFILKLLCLIPHLSKHIPPPPPLTTTTASPSTTMNRIYLVRSQLFMYTISWRQINMITSWFMHGIKKNIQEIQDQIIMPMSCVISTLHAHTRTHACTYTHRKQKNKIRKYEEAMHQAKCPQGCHKFWYQTTLHFHEIIWLHFTVCALDIGNKRVQQHLPPKCQHPTLQTAMSGVKTMWYPPTECPTRYHELLWPSSKAPGWKTNRHGLKTMWYPPTECPTRYHELLWPSSKAPGWKTNRRGLKTMWYPPTECPTRYHELFWPSSKAPGWKANRHGLDSPLQCSLFSSNIAVHVCILIATVLLRSYNETL